MIVRKMTMADFPEWKRLIAEGDLQHHEALPHLIKPPAQCRRTQEDYLSFVNDLDNFFVCIETNDQIHGFIHAKLIEKYNGWIHYPQTIVKVEEIVIAQSDHRKGYGSLLQRALLEWAKEKQANAIELNVYNFNQSAMQFYEKSGYKVLSHTMRLKLNT